MLLVKYRNPPDVLIGLQLQILHSSPRGQNIAKKLRLRSMVDGIPLLASLIRHVEFFPSPSCSTSSQVSPRTLPLPGTSITLGVLTLLHVTFSSFCCSVEC